MSAFAMRFASAAWLTMFAALAAVAQPSDRLPGKLSGNWTYVAPGGKTFIDALSIAIDGTGEPGPVTGRLTARGINCGAQDEPLKGSWDGTVLRFDTVHRPNVNTQRANGQCGDGSARYALERKPGSSVFEGTITMGNAVIQVSASP